MEALNPKWFEARWNDARSRAGRRYTPDLDVTLPIYDFFEAVGQSSSFFDKLAEFLINLQNAAKRLPIAALAASTSKASVETLRQLVNKSVHQVEDLASRRKVAPLQLSSESAVKTLVEAEQSAEALYKELRTFESKQAEPERTRTDHLFSDLQSIQAKLADAHDFLTGQLWKATNSRKILISGPAGTGKTHLLCEMTQRRIRNGFPSLLFLGQAFRFPFADALEVLMHSVAPGSNPVELLAAIDAYARRGSVRCVIAIDAINEGDRDSWMRSLPALVEHFAAYEGIALAISCRSPFERVLLPSANALGFQHVFHAGYPADEQDVAVDKYFKGYAIPLPEVPLLEEEFSNPLFLKLFCEAIEKVTVKAQHAKIHDIAAGQRGMTHIFEYFVDQKDRYISKRLGTTPGLCWDFLKNAFAPELASTHSDVLPRQDALALANNFQPKSLASGSLLDALIEDDILAEDVAFSRDAPPAEVVRFTYQKFADHLVARHLLAAQLDTSTAESIKASLRNPQRLGFFFQDEETALKSMNVAQALMIEFPTRIKNRGELLDFLGWKEFPNRLCESFIEGLYWREPESINGSTLRWISGCLDHKPLRKRTLDVVLALAVKPKHPCNFERLDRFLFKQSLSERDLLWTEYLRESQSSGTPLRIVTWAEHATGRALSNEFTQAYVAVLKWFLTSTQRGFRDRVTHALFRIGCIKPEALFKESIRSLVINDPYVSERMLAASYGVAMARWHSHEFKKKLLIYAKDLFRSMFKPGSKYATTHILSRDYAYHTIDIALMLSPGLLSKSERTFITPPFQLAGIRTWQEADDRDKGKYRNGDAPLGMDFENYTLGRLVRGRSAYDFQHEDYQKVRKQILWRIYDLGYTLEEFSAIDQQIARESWYAQQRGRENSKTDRYGKKYAWIAFYELAGYRDDLGLLQGHEERLSDTDIDPSFPELSASNPILVENWIPGTGSVREWLRSGYRPRIEETLVRSEVDGTSGPWVLLHGHVDRSSETKSIFVFLDGLLVRQDDTARLIEILRNIGYPGNQMIPRPEEEHYTFAGEIPWAETWRRQQYPQSIAIGGDEVALSVPVRGYAWESYHSKENQLGSIYFLNKEISETLDLYMQIPDVMLAERGSQKPASVTHESGEPLNNFESFTFLRQDLLDAYLREKHLDLFVFAWGERRANYHNQASSEGAHQLEGEFEITDALHKQGFLYGHGSFDQFM